MGFNFAAFLFPEFWLLYRKMYRIALFVCGVLAVLILFLPGLADPLFVTVKLVPPDLIVHVGLGRLLLMLVCGSLGNVWYLAHARRKISEVRAMGLDGESYIKELARRGGTSFNAGIFGCYLPYIVAKLVTYVITDFAS